jgi:hypothetical protein
MRTMPLEAHAAALDTVLDSALTTCPCGHCHAYTFAVHQSRLYALIGFDAVAVQADGHDVARLGEYIARLSVMGGCTQQDSTAHRSPRIS